MKTEHCRSQFTFYASYFNAVDRLPKSRRAEAFYAIVLYALDGVEPEGLSAGVDGVFEACRPNIDSGRSKAEKVQNAKCKMQNETDVGGKDETEDKNEDKNKDKIKTKIKSKSEEERKTETEDKTETAAAVATASRGAQRAPLQNVGAGAVLPAPSLPERKENNPVFFGTTPLEQREPYAEMFRTDPILASAWRDLLAQGPGGRPLGDGEREKLLARLRAAPAWERLAILSDRLGSPLSRDWQSVRRRAGI